MRVYLPATIAMVRELVSTGKLTPLGGTGFALTPALRESYASGTSEELEYAALLEAARASLRLIATKYENGEGVSALATGDEDGAGSADPARRVVVSADVDDATERPDLDDAVVRVSGPVPMEHVAAVHMDATEAEDAVLAAAEVIDAADLGDEDAEIALGDAEDHELAWYASQELPFLLELL